jgi:hypothetical protein
MTCLSFYQTRVQQQHSGYVPVCLSLAPVWVGLDKFKKEVIDRDQSLSVIPY